MIQRSWALLTALSILLLAVFVVSSTGLFNIDEAIYVYGAYAFQTTGSFVVDNGFELFQSDSLRLWFLAEGPNGLAPQYPVGTTVLGAPLLAALGTKGLMIPNLVGGIGTLIATHALTIKLFGSVRAARLSVILLALATYWGEFVFGIWPHSLALLATTWAFLLSLDAFERDALAWRSAAFSGLVIGLGLLVRIDVILILPIILVLTILFARRVWATLIGGAVGLVPGVLILAASNAAKFGNPNPLSYGSAGGGTDLSTYAVLMGAGLVGLAALIGFRVFGDRIRVGAKSVGIAGLVLLAVVAASPAAPYFSNLLNGAYGLLIDATTLTDERAGVIPGPGGTLIFWGVPKKALLQSLPWLAVLGLLAGGFSERRRAIVIIAIFCGVLCLPFALKSWHGGLGFNMRYFLPMLPLLCGLGAVLILDLVDRLEDAETILGTTWAVSLAALLALFWIEPGYGPVLNQILPLTLASVSFVVCVLAGRSRNEMTTRVALVGVGLTLGMGSFLAYADLQGSQERRGENQVLSDQVSAIEGRVIVVGPPEAAVSLIPNEQALLAVRDRLSDALDINSLGAACAAGFRVVEPMRTGLQDLCPHG